MVTNQIEFKRGRDALAYFHNYSLKYPEYKLTLDQLVATLDSRTRNKLFVQGLGSGIIDSEASESQVRAGMSTLASYARGRLPESNGAFTQAIANSVSTNLSYVDATVFVVKESAIDIAEGAQELGDNLIKAADFLTDYKFIIFAVLAVGGYYVYLYSPKKSGDK